MPKSVSAAGTPFKQIITGGQRTTENPRSSNRSVHRFAQGATENTRSNNSHLHRFAQSATEIREASGRANAERASRPDSATASMRSSSGSHHTRSLDQLKRRKGWDSGTQDSWAKGMADWLFDPEPDSSNPEPDSSNYESSDKPTELVPTRFRPALLITEITFFHGKSLPPSN